MEPNFQFALLIALLAGLATGIGGFLSFVIKKDNYSVLSLGLGFSAGVMIYISFVEILPKATDSLVLFYDGKIGSWVALGAFFVGIGISMLVDKFVPDHIDPNLVNKNDKSIQTSKLVRTGIFTAIAISLHNFPEGLATFMAALQDPALGISIAIAIAIHNIPEGIAVALPVYYASGSKKKALVYAGLSGLAEPLGALIGYFFLASYFNDLTFGIIFAAVAGIMVYLAIDELLPMAREYDTAHWEMTGVVLGMVVISISLLLF